MIHVRVAPRESMHTTRQFISRAESYKQSSRGAMLVPIAIRNFALSLVATHPSQPPHSASIAAGTRNELRSQACGPREVKVCTQQSANACKVRGRAVTLFKSARVYASMFLQPTRSIKIAHQL